MSLSPMLGSLLTAQSVEPALDSVSPSLSAPPQLMRALSLSSLSLSLSLKINKLKKKNKRAGFCLVFSLYLLSSYTLHSYVVLCVLCFSTPHLWFSSPRIQISPQARIFNCHWRVWAIDYHDLIYIKKNFFFKSSNHLHPHPWDTYFALSWSFSLSLPFIRLQWQCFRCASAVA